MWVKWMPRITNVWKDEREQTSRLPHKWPMTSKSLAKVRTWKKSHKKAAFRNIICKCLLSCNFFGGGGHKWLSFDSRPFLACKQRAPFSGFMRRTSFLKTIISIFFSYTQPKALLKETFLRSRRYFCTLFHTAQNKEKGSKSQDLTPWSSRTKKSKQDWVRIVVSFFWHSYVLRLRSKINVFNICADLPPRLVVTPPLSQSLEKAQWWEKKIENLVYVKSTYFFGVQEAVLLSNFFICQ